MTEDENGKDFQCKKSGNIWIVLAEVRWEVVGKKSYC